MASVLAFCLVFGCMCNLTVAFALDADSALGYGEDLAAELTDFAARMEAALAELEKTVQENADQMDAEAVENLMNDIDEVQNELDAIKGIFENVGSINPEDLQNGPTTGLDNLKASVEALKGSVATAGNAKVQKSFDIFYDIYRDPITGKYMLSEDSYYVAIGDVIVMSDNSYADKLAGELGIGYSKLGQNDLRAEDTIALLEEHANEVKKADLITIGFSNNAMIKFMADQVGSFRPKVLDWEALVGEEALPYVNEALSTVKEKMSESGMDNMSADMAMKALENYAYAYVSYVKHYPDIIEKLHELNPDALIAMVGMSNTLEGLELEAGVEAAPAGEYIGLLVEAANLESLACALLVDNAFYVEAPDVETKMKSDNVSLGKDILTILRLLAVEKNRALLYPSAAGQVYIKDQIQNALIFVDTLLGDVNLDGQVNSADTNLLYRYVMKKLSDGFTNEQLFAADVNEDGVVNSADTNLLYRFVMKKVPALGAQ